MIPRHRATAHLRKKHWVSLAYNPVTLKKVVNGAQGVGKLGGILQKLAHGQALQLSAKGVNPGDEQTALSYALSFFSGQYELLKFSQLKFEWMNITNHKAPCGVKQMEFGLTHCIGHNGDPKWIFILHLIQIH